MTQSERLSELLKNATIGGGKHTLQSYLMPESIDRIAEQLIENGVIISPVKVGQPVFLFRKGKVKETRIEKIEIYPNGKIDFLCDWHGMGYECFVDQNIGETVFLTREEAERALVIGNGRTE